MDTSTQAESSTAIAEPVEIPKSGTESYAEWRLSGTIPEKPKKADPAPAEKTESGDAADPAAPKGVEKPAKRRPDVEARFKTFSDEIKKLRQELDEARNPKKQEVQTPRNYEDWRSGFKVKAWTDAYAAQNPNASWEEIQDALTDYKADVREAYRNAERETENRVKQVSSRLNEARRIYSDFDSVARPVLTDLLEADGKKEIDPFISRMINDSPFLPHLLYVIGGSEETRADFAETVRRDPRKAAWLITNMEDSISKELSKKSSSSEPAKTTAQKEPPRTAAPPIEIGSRGGVTMDESERAMDAMKKGDLNAFAAWKRAEDRKDLARRRGI